MSQSSGFTILLYLGVSRGEHESFGEGLLPDARAEARRPDSVALLHLQGASELIEAVASVGVVDGARAESTLWPGHGGRVSWSRMPTRLAGSTSVLQGRLVA